MTLKLAADTYDELIEIQMFNFDALATRNPYILTAVTSKDQSTSHRKGSNYPPSPVDFIHLSICTNLLIALIIVLLPCSIID